MELADIVADLASAFKAEDDKRLQPKPKYQQGLGPYDERVAVAAALQFLAVSKPASYGMVRLDVPYPHNTKRKCDIVLPDLWAIEVKLLRPFNDNGSEAEGQWVQNVLHPYPTSPGANSAIADYVRLQESDFPERKAIIIYGFEHSLPVMPLSITISAFELIARQIVGLNLGQRYEARFTELVHPVHQQGAVFGWEVK